MPTAEQPTFSGYSPPGSNTTYTPNQFFDVVLPHSSRGVVRIVGYMLRRILGWSDANGNPVQSQVAFTYSDLIKQANVSRSMIKEAVDEAISRHFIRCVREPRPKMAGQSAVSGVYELNWSDEAAYIKDIEYFRGFFSGNGNLTNIPNDFFDYTLREEPLSVIRVVGAIARHTIGFQTSYGFRRQEVQASMSRLHRLTGISSRDLLSEAIQESVKRGHIVRVVEGKFEAGSSKDSIATIYALRWRDGITARRRADTPSDDQKKFAVIQSARKSPAVGRRTQDVDRAPRTIRNLDRENRGRAADLPATIGSKSGPSDVKGDARSVRNLDRADSIERFEKWTENGSETGPTSVRKLAPNRFDNRTGIEITKEITPNNSSKPAAAGIELLLQVGFDEAAAEQLAARFDAEVIARQVAYLPARKRVKNPLGLLRRAIEEDWAPPLTARPPAPRPVRVDLSSTSTADYQEFLQEESRKLKTVDLMLWALFEEQEQAARAILAHSPLISESIRERILQEFDDESRRTKRWIEFAVSKKRLPSLLDWQSGASQSRAAKRG
jgi:hypothetical protein